MSGFGNKPLFEQDDPLKPGRDHITNLVQKKYSKEQVLEMIETAIEHEADQWDGQDKINARYHGVYIKKKVERLLKTSEADHA